MKKARYFGFRTSAVTCGRAWTPIGKGERKHLMMLRAPVTVNAALDAQEIDVGSAFHLSQEIFCAQAHLSYF